MKDLSKKGFTVIEMVIYMSILSLFIVVLTQIFTSALDIQLESQSTSDVEHDGRFILMKLIYDIRRSDNISIPSTIGESGPNLTMNIGGTTYAYSFDNINNNLTLNDGSGTSNVNGYNTSVLNLTFERIGNTGGKNSINVIYSVRSKTIQNKGYETRDYQSTITLR